MEDEYVVATDLAYSLEELGAAVAGPAGSVEDALALVMAGSQIDAAFLDVNQTSCAILASIPVASKMA